MSNSVYSYKPLPKDNAKIEQALQERAKKHSEEGLWKAYDRLRNGGKPWDHKRVHRVYKTLGLPWRRKVKKRPPARVKEPLEVPNGPNHTWSMDFATDVLKNRRRFRSFNVIDDFNREALHFEVDFSLTGASPKELKTISLMKFWKTKQFYLGEAYRCTFFAELASPESGTV